MTENGKIYVFDKRGLETNLNPNILKVRLKVSYGRLKVRFPSVIF